MHGPTPYCSRDDGRVVSAPRACSALLSCGVLCEIPKRVGWEPPPRLIAVSPVSEIRRPRRVSQRPPGFLSGRQDLNLRPPGPQPGALPDCATPRSDKRATGIEPALEAWKASVQPQHFARQSSASSYRAPPGRRAATANAWPRRAVREAPAGDSPIPAKSVQPGDYGLTVSQRPLAIVSALALGDYVLWNWSLGANHYVLALIAGLTLPPLAIVLVWLLAVGVARLVGRFTIGSRARAQERRLAALDRALRARSAPQPADTLSTARERRERAPRLQPLGQARGLTPRPSRQ